MEITELKNRLLGASIDDLVVIEAELKTLPESDKRELRRYIINAKSEPYLAVTWVLMENPEPPYEQLLDQMEKQK